MRRITIFSLVAAGAAGSVLAFRCRSERSSHRGPRTDHFDGSRFHNIRPFQHGALDLWKWQLSRDPGEWRDWTDAPPASPPPERVHSGIRTTFINHATLLIQMDGVNILTDPIWAERCSPVSWAGPKRRRPPGVRFEDLPPIDLVVLSHNHYDHLDLPTLGRLSKRDSPMMFVGMGNRSVLEDAGLDVNVIELDWWQRSKAAPPLDVHFVPARHFSARGICDRNVALWGGWMISGPSGRAYFAGDTGWDDHFAEIKKRFGPPDVAMLPIGAFRPRWFMSPVHIGPDQAVEAHRVLGARKTIPMHYGTFFLGDDGETEAIDALRAQIAEEGLAGEFAILDFGESVEIIR